MSGAPAPRERSGWRRHWPAWLLSSLAFAWIAWKALDWMVGVGPESAASRSLLPALSLALVVLALGLAGILIRNLVTLIVERKRGILGSRLRIKLVFFFFALVLVPAFVLFYGSATVIRHTVEAILRTPLEQLTSVDEAVGQWTRYFDAESLQRARLLADEIGEGDLLAPDRRERLAERLERHLRGEGIAFVRVVAADRVLAAAESPVAGDLPARREERVRDLVREALASESGVSRMARLGERLLAESAVPLPATASDPGLRACVVVSLPLPAVISRSAVVIDEAVSGYHRFRVQRREMVRFFLTLIGLIFLATLLVATWLGFYLARRITDPIRQVAAAAREISAGNLDVRVRARAGDETSVLVDAFNDMAGELEQNRTVIARSTADLRRTNRALDDRRRYIETLVANLSTAVISLDTDGRLTLANPAAQRILGIALPVGQSVREELVRAGLADLAGLLDDPETAGVALRRDLELPLTAPTQNVAVQVAPLGGSAGERLGTLIMIEDLTDLLRAQKAQAWQEVARRIAHEIKNPLTPIQLAAQRLRRKFSTRAADLDEVLLESTSTIEREVSGLKQLVDEFSRYARMPETRPEPVQLAQVVESVLPLYRELPGVRLHVELDPRVASARVDPRQLRRALINLLDNAVAAVGGDGEIRIETHCGAREGSLRIEVADDGPGIPPEDRDKMFVPYFSTKKRGTGLGLAIVHKVVTDHQGTIRIEDNEPRGARFVIELPA